MTTDTRSEYFETGQDTGHDIATWVDIPENLPEGECAEYCGACDTLYSRIHCYMVNEVIEGELNGRQYADFINGIGYELNNTAPYSAWDDYDEGIEDGARTEITKRLDAYFS